jgi:hypothetical protein
VLLKLTALSNPKLQNIFGVLTLHNNEVSLSDSVNLHLHRQLFRSQVVQDSDFPHVLQPEIQRRECQPPRPSASRLQECPVLGPGPRCIFSQKHHFPAGHVQYCKKIYSAKSYQEDLVRSYYFSFLTTSHNLHVLTLS